MKKPIPNPFNRIDPVAEQNRRRDYFEVGDGVAIQFNPRAKPYIRWNHVDGPLLHTRVGTLHWLTWWERLQMQLRWIDIYALERKHSPPGLLDKWKRRAFEELQGG